MGQCNNHKGKDGWSDSGQSSLISTLLGGRTDLRADDSVSLVPYCPLWEALGRPYIVKIGRHLSHTSIISVITCLDDQNVQSLIIRIWTLKLIFKLRAQSHACNSSIFKLRAQSHACNNCKGILMIATNPC